MFSDDLMERKLLLEETLKKIGKEMPKLSEGNLRISKKGNTQQYFHVTEKDNIHGKFIKAEDFELVKQLAQRTYYEKLLKAVQSELKATIQYINATAGKSPEDVYSSMNDYRKILVNPLLLPDDEYAKIWISEPFQGNPFRQEECIYETERGEYVRTKSEEMIANMYYELGVPYRYEAPVRLKNGKVKYPDFTVLKFPERRLVYHEHMGLMEDDDYRKANIEKIQEYAASGICTGKNLMLSFETQYLPFNIKSIRNMVKCVLQI